MRGYRKGREKRACIAQVLVPRDYAHDKYATVDGRTFGGGPGMLMMVGPLREAIAEARKSAGGRAKVLYMSPQGRRLDQEGVIELSREQRLILVCGRYEGIDQRVIDSEIDEEWSVGDYVLSGGELPAMIMIDAVSRMIPGVLGDEDSAEEDSFMHGLLDFPSTPGLRALTGWMSRRFSGAAITARSENGGWKKRSGALLRSVRI